MTSDNSCWSIVRLLYLSKHPPGPLKLLREGCSSVNIQLIDTSRMDRRILLNFNCENLGILCVLFV